MTGCAMCIAMQDALLEEVKDMRWGQFKSVLADAIVAHLEPIQQKYHDVIADKTYLDQVCPCLFAKSFSYVVSSCNHGIELLSLCLLI